MADLYEELPSDAIQEDLYEDLPDSAYTGQDYSLSNGRVSCQQGVSQPQQYQEGGGVPPPLPTTSSIPQFRPGALSPSHTAPPPPQLPPIPTRSPSTQLSSSTTAQLIKKKGKEKESVKRKQAPPPKSSGSMGVMDMSEILQKAKARRPIGNLEKSFKEEEPSQGNHVSPWANQLRKTNKVDEDRSASPDENTIPEFVKKARTLSIATDPDDEDPPNVPMRESSAPSPPRNPPLSTHTPTAKLRGTVSNTHMPAIPPKSAEVDSELDKHGFQKMRDKPAMPAQQGDVMRAPTKPVRPAPTKPPIVDGKPPPPLPSKQVSPVPSSKPGIASKPAPLAGKSVPALPKVVGRATNGEVEGQIPIQSPLVKTKPRPSPTPRGVVSNAMADAEERKDVTSPSFSNRETSPIPPVSRPPGSKGPPPPKPRRQSNMSQDSQFSPMTRNSSDTPPPFFERSSQLSLVAPATPELKHPPTGFKPPLPPPVVSKPSPPPPVVAKPPLPPVISKPPRPPPEALHTTHTFSTPPPPVFAPPSQMPPIPEKSTAKIRPPLLPISYGQATPPMGSVMKFRRLPLRPVDQTKPPPLPLKNTKKMNGT